MPTRWQNRRMCAHLLGRELQHYSSLLSNRQQENVGSHQKYLPHIKGKRRSHSKMIGRGKITFRITPYPPETQRAQTKPCAHQRLSQTCLWVFQSPLQRYGSPVTCSRGRGSGCHRPGCGVSPLGGDHHLPHHRATRTYTGLGKQTLEGHRQNIVHTRTQEKGAVSPQETDPDLPVSVQESPAEAWVSSGLLLHGWGDWV